MVGQNWHPSLKVVLSVAAYDQLSGRFVQGLKYQKHRVLARPLAESMARQATEALLRWKVEVLVPVPLHWKRYHERGFNQAGILAQVCGEKLGILVEWNLLTRTQWHGTQAKQSKTGRQSIQTMFRCTRRTRYTTVCLIDDVCTTGATVSACARALNQAGVKNVIALTFARA